MRSIRRRKWSSATNDSKSMLALAFGSNACTPCMTASLLENGCARDKTPPETPFNKENQAESKLIQSALFQQAPPVLTRAASVKCHDDLSMGVKRDDASLAWEFLAVIGGSDT